MPLFLTDLNRDKIEARGKYIITIATEHYC